MKELFDKVSDESAILITKKYSTSFSIAVRLLAPSIRQAIYNIYGFVRVADEIVDSFEGYPKEELLNRFEEEYAYARQNGISTNPVINAFQKTVKDYGIEEEMVQSFLKSMRADLTKQVYENQKEIDAYIYGSADVVGLMCLKVFVNGNQVEFDKLKESAMRLGSAFQKVNFLRDIKEDYDDLSRTYFPNVDPENFTAADKDKIIFEIKKDFKLAYKGLIRLPKEARFGVYVAYKYYLQLLKKVDKTPARYLKEKRIRVSNSTKTYLLFHSYMQYKLNIV
jgi:phytoene/squalene synthetase